MLFVAWLFALFLYKFGLFVVDWLLVCFVVFADCLRVVRVVCLSLLFVSVFCLLGWCAVGSWLWCCVCLLCYLCVLIICLLISLLFG